MNFKKFLRDRLAIICLFFFSSSITVIIMSLELINTKYSLRKDSLIYALVLNLILIMAFIFLEYLRKRSLYKNLNKMAVKKNPYYLFSLPRKYSNEDEVYREAITSIYSHYENELASYRQKEKTYKNFNNTWIHQMKTPVSVISLILENGLEGQEDILSLKEELKKLENGLDIALYNLRLQDFSLDFKVENLDLVGLIREVINENKNIFILNSIYPSLDIDGEIMVSTDRKWMKFVINQLIQNSIKYTKVKDQDKKEVIISSEKLDGLLEVSFYDNGVGIVKRDLGRIFNPFFTGENGREYSESTGMGLYLTKTVLDKLGHGIRVESVKGNYTKIILSFPDEKSIYNF